MADLSIIPEKLLDAPNEIIKAVALPTAKTAGDTFADLFFLAFGGISHLAEKRRVRYAIGLEAFEKECRKKIQAVPLTRRNEPSTQIVMQTLECAKSCVEEDELREMFANLVAAACNLDKVSYVVPAFPDVIRQLSPIDAKILKILSNKSRWGPIPMISCRDCFEISGNYFFRGYVRLLEDAHQEMLEQLLHLAEGSLSNFERLGILKCSESFPERESTIEHDYEWLEGNVKDLGVYKEVCQMQGNSNVAQIVRETINYTAFGLNFVEACVKNS